MVGSPNHAGHQHPSDANISSSSSSLPPMPPLPMPLPEPIRLNNPIHISIGCAQVPPSASSPKSLLSLGGLSLSTSGSGSEGGGGGRSCRNGRLSFNGSLKRSPRVSTTSSDLRRLSASSVEEGDSSLQQASQQPQPSPLPLPPPSSGSALGWKVNVKKDKGFRSRRFFPSLGQVDNTSLVAFRDAYGQTLSESQTHSPEKKGGERGEQLSASYYVRYGTSLTIYSNFGREGRFLVPAASRFQAIKRVEWLVVNTQEVPRGDEVTGPAQQHLPWLWMLHRVRDEEEVDKAADIEGSSPSSPSLARIGDKVVFESLQYPGHFLRFQEGAFLSSAYLVLDEGGNAACTFQLTGLSLAHAMQLDPFLSNSGTASAWTSLDERGSLESPIGDKSRTTRFLPGSISLLNARRFLGRGQHKQGRRRGHAEVMAEGVQQEGEDEGEASNLSWCLIEEMLPSDILLHILVFFSCLVEGGGKDSKAYQSHSGISITDRRGAARILLTVRQASHYWSQLSTDLISSIRVSEMEDLVTTGQRVAMLNMIRSCHNLSSLTLRNLDWLTDADMVRLVTSLPKLRSLNVGGCGRLTDMTVLLLKDMAFLEQLNLSVTNVSDVGLQYLMEGRVSKTLTTITLYGLYYISEEMVQSLVAVLPFLIHINLRGTGMDYEAGHRIKASCLNVEAQVLIGADLAHEGSIYGRARSPII